MGRKRRVFYLIAGLLLCCSLAVAETAYKMRFNPQTGRGDWVVADESLYTVSDTVYGAGWDGDTTGVASKNSLYDKIETIVGGGAPGGADTQVQINDGGVFFGESNFTYNKALHTLLVDRIVIGPGVADYVMPTVRGAANEVLTDNGAGATYWNAVGGSLWTAVASPPAAAPYIKPATAGEKVMISEADGFYLDALGYPQITWDTGDFLYYADDTDLWLFGINSTAEYSFSATEFDARSNSIKTTGTGSFTGGLTAETAFTATGLVDFSDFGTDIITGAAAVGTFESGDTFLCQEAGVGVRECDYDDLPAGGAGMTSFILEDADGTEISVSNLEEIKFIESTGIDIDWTDTTPGSDADPFDLTFTIEATLADISDGTIAENLVNTAHPWADDEVADDITASAYAPLAGATFTGGVSLDDGVGDSPSLSFVDADNNYFALIKYDAGAGGLFNNEGAIRLAPSNDTNDYLEVSTAAGITTMTTVAGGDDGDLVITAAGGEISFGDENVSTTGTHSATGGYTGALTGNADTVTDGVYTTDNMSVLAATSSAQLFGVLSDETGSGAGALAVFNISPQFETSILGNYLTASEILITDASKNIVSAAVATYPSLTELSYVKGLTGAIMTLLGDKAPLVSPSFTTPTLGVASATSINKVTITAPATGSTLTIEEGFTLTADGNATIQGTNTGDEAASSTTVAGVVELAITSEIDGGSDSTRAIPVDQFVASKRNIRWLVFNLVEAGTANTAANNNIGGDFVSPIAGTVLQSDSTPFYLYATNSTAGTNTGVGLVVDISFNGTSIMTTNKLDFDTTEKTTTTAATPPDLTDTTLAVGDIITIDVDTIHDGTASKGLMVIMGVRE